MAHPIEDIMGISMDKIHQMVDVNTIIGDPIVQGDTTIIPISKVSFGFASGGSDLPTQAAQKFAGGSGAGVTVKPVGFIVIKADGDVKLLELGGKSSPIEGVMENIPNIINKIKGTIADKKAAKESSDDSEKSEKSENGEQKADTKKAAAKVEKAQAELEKAQKLDEKAAERLSKAQAKVEAAKAEAQAQLNKEEKE